MKLKPGWGITLTASLLSCAGLPPGNVNSLNTTAAAETRRQLGLEYLARGDLNAARFNLEKAVNSAPEDYRAQLAMALYEQKIGENRAAKQRYQYAMQLAPENGTVLNNYGAFLCGLGHYVAAQQQFGMAAALPDYAQVADSFENAGYCFLKADNVHKAKEFLSTALKYDADKGEFLLAEAKKQCEEGRHARAQLLLDIYQNSLPASAESLWLQIRFAALTNRHDTVRNYGRQLAQNFPHSEQYQHFLANEY